MFSKLSLFKFFFLSLSLFLLHSGCSRVPHVSAPTASLKVGEEISSPVFSFSSSSAFFSVSIDGKQVGQEFRTFSQTIGPNGPENLYTSHSSVRYKMAAVRIDKKQVRVERASIDSNPKFLSASHVTSDPVKSFISVVSSDPNGLYRSTFSSSSVAGNTFAEPESFSSDLFDAWL